MKFQRQVAWLLFGGLVTLGLSLTLWYAFLMHPSSARAAATYTCVTIEQGRITPWWKFRADNGTDVLRQDVKSTADYAVRQGPQHNAWIVKETRAWWSRDDDGLNADWHPDNAEFTEVIWGYECTDDTKDHVVTKPSASFTPMWDTPYRTYEYAASNISSYPSIVPLYNCEGSFYILSEVKSDVYKGTQQIDTNWYTTVAYPCDE